jgi:hypothetical protein
VSPVFRILGWVAASSVLIVLAGACASPADLERKKLGSGKCAEQADEKCEESLPNADRLGCLKRETFLCEQLEENKTP